MVIARRRSVACVVSLLATFIAAPRPVMAFEDLGANFLHEKARLLGRTAGNESGTAVAIGDVSGDGVGDILVGSPFARGTDLTRDKAGQVAVVLGSDLLSGTVRLENAAYTIWGPYNQARLGTAVAAGDIDADGAPDIIMGAPEAKASHSEGATYVFFGGTRLTLGKDTDLAERQADLVLWGQGTGGRMGRALAVGDFNGDGRGDIAAAAPTEGREFGRDQAGAVCILFGRPGIPKGTEHYAGVHGSYLMQVRGPFAHSGLGFALAAGDVNGDGIDDLLMGAPVTLPEGNESTGDVFVLFGRGTLLPGLVVDLQDPAQVDLRIKGPGLGDRFASAVGSGNINGDQIADILIGAPESEFVPRVATGRAFAVFGRPFVRGTVIDLGTDNADVTLAGPDDKAELGFSVVGGDLNRDGVDDWVVGAPGADKTGEAYRMLGRPVWSEFGVVGALTQGARPGDRAGAALAIGDVTGDGIGDLAVGAPLYDGTGVRNGVPGDKPDSGAVYVFEGRDVQPPPSPSCTDADGDGFRAQGRTCGPRDCNDTNPNVYPYNNEICDDGIDNDCDGYTDVAGVDEDGDGWPGRDIRCGQTDCNDQDPNINPGIVEALQLCTDGVDNDCDATIDLGDPGCQTARETCTNCVDDDGDGAGDLLDTECAASAAGIEIKDAVVRRRGARARLVVRGVAVDASALGDLRSPVARAGLTAGVAVKDGVQECVALGGGVRAPGRAVQFSSPAKPHTTLRVKRRRDGRVEFRLEHRSRMTLPESGALMFTLGLYTTESPYRGSIELRASGRTTAAGGSGR